MSADPEFLTVPELAELLRIKERKVYDLASAGDVPCTRATGKLLFPARDVRAWIEGTLVEGRVVLKPARPVAPPRQVATLEEGVAVDSSTLQHTVSHWLHRLRPTSEFFPTGLWVVELPDDRLCVLEPDRVLLNPRHPLVSSASFSPSPEALAWLLLGLYAYINAEQVEVSNEHERRFQLALGRTLREGKLAYVMAPPES